MAYPMVDVGDAIQLVLAEASRLTPQAETIPAQQSLGRILSEDVVATEPFPPFQASILDGFAVAVAPNPDSDVYVLLEGKLTAGSSPPSDQRPLTPGEAIYITTGANLPPGATAVRSLRNAPRLASPPRMYECTLMFRNFTDVSSSFGHRSLGLRKLRWCQRVRDRGQ